MKLKTMTSVLASLVMVGIAHANILVGDHADHNDNQTTFSRLDTGWGSKEYWTGGDNGLTNTVPVWQANGAQPFGVQQVVSVGAAAGGELALSFDWTPAAGITNPAALTLDYQLVGWDTGGVAPLTTDIMFFGANFYSTTIGTADSGLPAGTVEVDFLSGTGPTWHHSGTGAGYPNSGTLTSTAGATVSFNNTFSAAIAGNADVSDYDYIGVRFTVNCTSDPGNVGSTVSNISLEAVPEPASLGLVGLFGGGIMFLRRYLRI